VTMVFVTAQLSNEAMKAPKAVGWVAAGSRVVAIPSRATYIVRLYSIYDPSPVCSIRPDRPCRLRATHHPSLYEREKQ